MKKEIILSLLILGVSAFGAESTSSKRFRPIKLVNADFCIPSSTGIVGWSIQNNFYPGELTVEGEAPDKYLKITPLPNKINKPDRTLIFNTTTFNAGDGDLVKISYQARSSKGGKIGVILVHKRRCQWASYSGKYPTSAKWKTVEIEYTVKQGKDAQRGDYYLGFDVINNPVEIRNVKISIQRNNGTK